MFIVFMLVYVCVKTLSTSKSICSILKSVVMCGVGYVYIFMIEPCVCMHLIMIEPLHT
jgi:hypothetical protein